MEFSSVKQVIERFSTHDNVRVSRIRKGLYGIHKKGNPEWSEPEWVRVQKYNRTDLLDWANRFFPHNHQFW